MGDTETDTMEKLKDAMRSLLSVSRAYPYIPERAEDDALEQFVEAMAKEIGRRMKEQ